MQRVIDKPESLEVGGAWMSEKMKGETEGKEEGKGERESNRWQAVY